MYARRRNLRYSKLVKGGKVIYKILPDPNAPVIKKVPVKKVKEVRFSTVIDGHDENFKLDKVVTYLQKGNPVKMMVVCKEHWNFDRPLCETKIKELLAQIDREAYSVQQSEVVVPSSGAFGCIIAPRPAYFTRKEQELAEKATSQSTLPENATIEPTLPEDAAIEPTLPENAAIEPILPENAEEVLLAPFLPKE